MRGYYGYPWNVCLQYIDKEYQQQGKEDEMTPEQARQLEACYNRLTRTDTQGWNSPDGHDMFGRVNSLQVELEKQAKVLNEILKKLKG